MARATSLRAASALALAAAAIPLAATAQVEVSTGILLDASPGVGDARVGPLLSLGVANSALGFPLFLEASVARTDFGSLGREYHHNYYLFALGTYRSLGDGPTRLELRLGLGALGEYEIVEGDPSTSGGDNWIEAVVPGLILTHEINSGLTVVAGASDHMLNPLFAIFDPEENEIDHRWRVMVGIRF